MVHWRSAFAGAGVAVVGAAVVAIFISDGLGRAGTLAKTGEFPWHVSVRVGTGTGCGGSLIAERWVLTAAHCAKVNATWVRIGSLNHNTGTKFEIERSIAHKLYAAGSGNRPSTNDIGLLRLKLADPKTPLGKEQAATLRRIKLPAVATDDASVNFAATAGWSCTLPKPLCFGTDLRYVVLTPNHDPEGRCKNTYVGLVNSMLCMGRDVATADTDDSGGGLATALVRTNAMHPEIIGVASFTASGKPTVFTRASCFKNWVEACMNNAPECTDPKPEHLPAHCASALVSAMR